MADRVLVTGADGFIGSHLTEALVAKGERVRALCCYNSFGQWGWLDTAAPDVKDAIEVVMGDVRDDLDLTGFDPARTDLPASPPAR